MSPNSENQYQLRILPRIAESYLQFQGRKRTNTSNASYKVAPDTFPIVATNSTNASKAGNGDFPKKYVAEALLVQLLIANSRGQL